MPSYAKIQQTGSPENRLVAGPWAPAVPWKPWWPAAGWTPLSRHGTRRRWSCGWPPMPKAAAPCPRQWWPLPSPTMLGTGICPAVCGWPFVKVTACVFKEKKRSQDSDSDLFPSSNWTVKFDVSMCPSEKSVSVKDALLKQQLPESQAALREAKAATAEDWQQAESIGRLSRWEDLHVLFTAEAVARKWPI